MGLYTDRYLSVINRIKYSYVLILNILLSVFLNIKFVSSADISNVLKLTDYIINDINLIDILNGLSICTLLVYI